MAFWNKKKEPKKPPDRTMENYQKTVRRGLAKVKREKVELVIDVLIKNAQTTAQSDYKHQALQMAFTLDQSGKTKKEVLILAYRQIRDALNQENTNLDDHFKLEQYRYVYAGFNWGGVSHSDRFDMVDLLTDQDRQAYLDAHRKPLTTVITQLEKETAAKRDALDQKQQITQTVQSRLNQIQHQQQARENEIDQQIDTVDAQIQKVLEALTQQKERANPKQNGTDLDRLETMLDDLRRLKNE